MVNCSPSIASEGLVNDINVGTMSAGGGLAAMIDAIGGGLGAFGGLGGGGLGGGLGGG